MFQPIDLTPLIQQQTLTVLPGAAATKFNHTGFYVSHLSHMLKMVTLAQSGYERTFCSDASSVNCVSSTQCCKWLTTRLRANTVTHTHTEPKQTHRYMHTTVFVCIQKLFKEAPGTPRLIACNVLNLHPTPTTSAHALNVDR